MWILLLLAGLLVLCAGAELVFRGAASVAAGLGLSPLMIGLTIVAFGTSAPELAVSVKASLDGQPSLALGNVVGSNIFNVLLILGLSALIQPIKVEKKLVKIDIPIMVAVTAAALLLSLDGLLSRLEGVLLCAGIVAYTLLQWKLGKQEPDDDSKDAKPELTAKKIALDAAAIVAGLVLLVFGARWFVGGAVILAQLAGIPELAIGLTIVAAGTSFPELAASVMAAIRKQTDMSVGNVVGSNIFNICAILGLSAIISAGGIPVSASFDMLVMLGSAAICLPLFFTGFVINRIEGAALVVIYALYTGFLILQG
jgi:cation:H+ antiporter